MKRQEKDKSRVILGIDPGSIVCGYGAIRAEILKARAYAFRNFHLNSSCPSYIASGRIVLSSKHPFNVRLKELYDGLIDIIKEYSPDEVAVEKIFFAKGIKAALALGQARGVVLIAAASCGLPVYEYSALEVKKSVVGYGRAEKHQVQGMVSKILNLKTKLSKDSADALGLALCHVSTLRIGR